MAEEKRSLLQRLRHLLFGSREANRADQKERREELTGFLKEREEEAEERAAAAREEREA